MPLMFSSCLVRFSATSTGSPVVRSMDFAQLTWTKGCAFSSSPVIRSSVYANPLRSKWTSALRVCPFSFRSTSMLSLTPS